MNWVIPLVISYLIARNDADLFNSEDVYSSLALVFDTTGSMKDDYQQLKSHAEGIMRHVLTRNDSDIKHFVFVPFNDPDVGPMTETFDPNVIMYKLNRVAIKGGGDCAEMGITAVVQALKIIKPNSYVYVFTDASAKDTYLVDEALELIQRKQSQVFVLKTGDCDSSSDNSYQTIALVGSGNVFDVNKGDVSKVLELVNKSMDTNKVNLMSVNIGQSQLSPSPKKLNIDESIKNLQVSVSGLNCNIDLMNPAGKKMDEAQGLMTELDLKNVKIVNVLEPIPGEWTLYVTSESAHSIRACGVSSKNFNFGFATAKPKNMTQTSHRPLKGANNYILIDCPDVTKFISCKTQDLYNENKTYSLPILELEKHNMLLCGPFLPNNNPFYIQVFGMNSNGHYFRRITKTSIIPDEPDAPYINTPTQITAVVGGELRIKCRVESLVPFTVSWIGFNCPRQTWNFSQSSEIELVIRNVTEQFNDIYTCRARNIAGNAESTTNVTVISMPTIVEGSDNVTIVLYEGEDYSMTCMGHGRPVPKMTWHVTNVPVSYYDVEHILIINDALRLIIYDATLKDSNVYTCTATNEAGLTEKHYNVIVKAKTIDSVANETLVEQEIGDVVLHCPLPNMTNQWLKDGSSVNDLIHKRADEPHYRLLKDGLKIYDLDVIDSAVYTCMNSNETYTIELKVAFAPYFIKYQPESMMIKRNETVLFDCMATGYPIPRILWRKMDSSLPITRWTLKDIEFLENKQKLTIHSVDWIHNGTYKCIVKNKFGIVKRRFDLLVF
ncbi:hemicentin-1-like isoform X3 [Sipha flava]|nr:hemicentin-1-like isoform X3 [Sipha flava]XP_025417796.1 hemicentin-1-like isoform X3 [Sipha flava]